MAFFSPATKTAAGRKKVFLHVILFKGYLQSNPLEQISIYSQSLIFQGMGGVEIPL